MSATVGRVVFPPYAPSLNPVEGLWNCNKCDWRANFVPDTIGQLNEAVEQDLKEINPHPELLKGLHWTATTGHLVLGTNKLGKA